MHALTFAGLITRSLMFIAFVSLGACNSGGSTSGTPVPFSSKLVKATDPGDLETRIKAELTRRYERMYDSYAYGDIAIAGGAVVPPPPMSGNQPSASNDTGTLPHSETNIQESGVDEGDLVKTDGAFIYLARGSHFFILKATPASETAIVSDIDLQEPVNELHLAGTRVIVITTPILTGPSVTVTISSPTGIATVRSVTRVYDYDVSTPAQPVLTARYDFPGSLQGSRRINSRIYLITNHSIDLPSPVTPWDYLSTGTPFDSACAQAKQENLNRIEALTLDDLLPSSTATLFTAGAGTSSTSPVIAPGDVYIPEFGNSTDLALVISLDLTGATPVVSTSGVMSSWCTIYMTTDSLYLASGNSWQWIMPLVGEGMPQGNPEPRTAVHKFSLSEGAGKPLYAGSGVVNGWINDRFSMGDYLGYLRIGTTRGGWWGEDISNQLAILSQGTGTLIETGKITGLAPGERIYSMRFDRDRGYMVTFRQTDPLYTFDLSDPRNPRIAGEIVVNGFATYIHLLGTDTAPRLLTIGRSADATGRVTGNKLQLFDVSSLSAPQLLGDYELGAGWSDALYDPHAFLYYEPLGILTIPYYAFAPATGDYRSGLNVFNIGPASIGLRGIIHATALTSGYGTYEDTVDRSVIIGSSIYAVAHRSVIAAGADQLNVLAAVDLPESYTYYPLVVTGGTRMGAVRN